MSLTKDGPRADANDATGAATPPAPVNHTEPSEDRASAEGIGFPVVGVGASAGGLGALESFFSGIPAGVLPGMAFVVVQHLSPDHESVLAELLQRHTHLSVFAIEDGMPIRPNCVYVIPPDRDLILRDGTLQFVQPPIPRSKRLSVDLFFRSLAQAQRERAIGIVLSGSGSDGAQGLRAIKGEGGMTMAQLAESAEVDAMPRSAVATGLVDYILPPEAMAAQLMSYVQAHSALPTQVEAAALPSSESELMSILGLLRTQTDHDFTQHKRSTVQRRIERRMALRRIDTLEAYARYLKQTPVEVDALFREMLIGVTSFFRDRDAFLGLQSQLITGLLAARPDGTVIRVWVPGCSTGEEPYSLAMLLQEQVDLFERNHRILIFASDVDSQAIATARAGLYPASIAADVSPERLARFFIAEPDGSGYRVDKRIRDLIVFSEHDVTRDPPFSRVDLISCRNLLIYMGADLQRKLLRLFHYALNDNGLLFLGNSEGIGELSELFSVLDRKAKIYRRKSAAPTLTRTGGGRLADIASLKGGGLAWGTAQSPDGAAKISLREIAEQELLRMAPASALVNGDGDILYLHGRSGLYLEPAAGESGVNNILKMAREGLRRELTTALHKASAEGAMVHRPGLRVRTNGHHTMVNLTVRPVNDGAPTRPGGTLFLVVLEDSGPDIEVKPSAKAPGASTTQGTLASPEAEARIAALEHELRAREDYIDATSEELEASNEHLRASNEAMQTVNEELQSTNEELETSKEELQSVNEELATVNAELQNKVADLSRLNNDIINLMAGTGIATVFVDRKLCVVRFTPAATRITNLIPSDEGRPLAHIVSNLVGYDTLGSDAQAVLDTLAPRDVEVRAKDGSYYALGMRPYRTLDDEVEGVVITFVDISAIKRAQQSVIDSEERYHNIMNSVADSVVVLDAELRIAYINRVVTPGLTTEQVVGSAWLGWLDPADQAHARAAIEQALATRAPTTLEFRAVAPSGEVNWFQVKFSCLPSPGGDQVVLIARNISERKQREEDLRVSDLALKAVSQGVLITAPDATILSANDAFLATTGYSREEVLGRTSRFLHGPRTDPGAVEATRAAVREGREFAGEILNYRKDGTPFWNELTISPVRDADGVLTHFIGVTRDITARRDTEEKLRWKRTLLQLITNATPQGSLVVDHRTDEILHFNARFCEIWRMPELASRMQAGELKYSEIVAATRPIAGDVDAFEVARPFAEAGSATVHDELELKDGRKLRRFTTPIHDASGQYYGRFYTFEDVTEQRRAEQENAHLEARLRQVDKMESVGRLAGGVAHDFNNMLGVILGHAELAMSDLRAGHPLFADLSEIRAAAERSAGLTQQLLAFARKQTVAPRLLNLNDLVAGSLSMIQRLIGEQIEVRTELAPDLWTLKLDASQVDQILTNLCVNARDAVSDVGVVQISTRNVTLDAEACEGLAEWVPGDYVRLTVSDTGSGIEPEALRHIFEPFFTTKAVGRGTGLGLSTVYGAVKQNHGFIRVSSELGKGTSFEIYLPRHVEPAASRPPPAPASRPEKGKETILLVEDELAILRLTAKMLRRQGYTVLEASSPLDAIAMTREYAGEIHLLITDVVMPTMNGRDLAMTLLAQHPTLKRLFMSGYPADVIAQHGVLDRGVHFIEKPFSVADLAAEVRRALDA